MKTLFLILFPFLVFGQLSNGFVLDGSYFMGHNAYINCFDTTGQNPSSPNVPENIKFSLNTDASSINTINDTAFVFPYSGRYSLIMNFVYGKSSNGGASDYMTIFSQKNRQPLANSEQIYEAFDDNLMTGHHYNGNYSVNFFANTNDTLKIKYMTTDVGVGFYYNAIAVNNPSQPAINLLIHKISD